MASYQNSNSSVGLLVWFSWFSSCWAAKRGSSEFVDAVLIGWVLVGMEYPPGRGKTLGIRMKQGLSLGLVTSMKTRSGPGCSLSASGSSGAGPSSVMGLLGDVARLSFFVIASVGVIVMTLPRTSRIRTVTGQMISILSPRVPAKMGSLVAVVTVGKGQLRTARVALGGSSWVVGSIKKANCLVSPESQKLASLDVSGYSLLKVAARRSAWLGLGS